MIISNNNGKYELSHKMLNDLRLRVLGNLEISGKSQDFMELQPSAQSFSENLSFVKTCKKLLKNRK